MRHNRFCLVHLSTFPLSFQGLSSAHTLTIHLFCPLCRPPINVCHQIIQQINQICPIQAYPVREILFLLDWHMNVIGKAKTMAKLMSQYFAQITIFRFILNIYSSVVPICHSKACRAIRAHQFITCAVNKFYFPFNTIY